jgi:hypothetical protein
VGYVGVEPTKSETPGLQPGAVKPLLPLAQICYLKRGPRKGPQGARIATSILVGHVGVEPTKSETPGLQPGAVKPLLPLAQICYIESKRCAGPHSARTTTSKPTSRAAANTASRMKASNFTGSARRAAASVGYFGVIMFARGVKRAAGGRLARSPKCGLL